MQTISISKLKKARAEEMSKRQSVVIEADGVFIGVLIIAPQLDMKNQVTSLAGIIEAGRDHEEW